MICLVVLFLCELFLSVTTMTAPLLPVHPVDVPQTLRGQRIVTGTPAQPQQFPWQVRILALVLPSSSYACGGTLISESWVLTAAHCTHNRSLFQLTFGTINFHTADVHRTTSQKVEHPHYDPTFLRNDVALLTFAGPLMFNNAIRALALPRPDIGPLAGRTAVAIGWGRTSDRLRTVSKWLNYASLTVIPNAQCARYYVKGLIAESTLCTTDADMSVFKSNVCLGDSGGPLVAFDPVKQQDVIVGVISFVSSRGCESTSPSGYARVSSFVGWIRDVTGAK